MSTYIAYSSRQGVPVYANVASLPVSASDGATAVALDTDTLYIFNAGTQTWIPVGGSTAVLTIGTIDTGTPSANGAQITSNALIMQSASVTRPGLVNNGPQSFSGNKTFTGTIAASNFSGSSSGTNTGDVTLGAANGLSLAGQVLSLQAADASHTGALTSADWTTFNSKQAAGSYITALTDDVTAAGPGSASATIAAIQGTTVSGTTGTGNVVFSDAPTLTGELDGASAVFSSTISASNLSGTNTGDVTLGTANGLSLLGQALSLQAADGSHTGALTSSDWTTFNSKQAAGNYITALTGDATASGPGSAALTLATVNGSPGSFGDASHSLSATVNGKGLITSLSANSIQIAESQVTNLVSDLAGKQPVGNYITALTGDVTAAGPGSSAATIAANAVTNAKLAQMATLTIKGNDTGLTADPSDLTVAAVNAILPVFTDTLNGLTPLSGGGSTNFLRADGTWAVPSGTGVTSVGAFGSSPTANAASISGTVLTIQPADGTHPGAVSTGTQSFGGNKTFTGTIGASNFSGTSSGTNTGDASVTTTNGLSIAGQVISLQAADTTHNGALTSTDWNTFNGKQAAGNYITALTGDVTASGPGSSAATIASHAVTNSKLAQMPTLTLKGNNTGGTADALDLTVSQVNTMLGTLVNPMTTFGDMIYGDTGGTPDRLAPNVTTTTKFLTQVGDGVNANSPGWNLIAAADVPNLDASKITTGTLPIARGGTNASTAAGAFNNLVIAANAQSSTYTLLTTDDTVNFTTSTSTLTATLPTAVGISGKRFTINKIDGNTGKVTILTTSSQTIGGIASNVIILGNVNDSITVESDGANYQIVNFNIFVGCRYNSTTAQSLSNAANTVVFFENKDYDPWGLVTNAGTTSFTFTAPIPGMYEFSARVGTASTLWAATDSFDLRTFLNGSGTANAVSPEWYGQSAITITADVQVFDNIKMAAGDTVVIKASLGHSTSVNSASVARTMYFFAHRLSS